MISERRQYTVLSIVAAGLGALVGLATLSSIAYLGMIAPIGGWQQPIIEFVTFLGMVAGAASPLFPFYYLRDKLRDAGRAEGSLLILAGGILGIGTPFLLAVGGGFDLFSAGGTRTAKSFMVVLNGLLGVMLGAPMGPHIVDSYNPHKKPDNYRFGA